MAISSPSIGGYFSSGSNRYGYAGSGVERIKGGSRSSSGRLYYQRGKKVVNAGKNEPILSLEPTTQANVAVDVNQIETFNRNMKSQGYNAGSYLQALKAQAAGQKMVYVDHSQVNEFNQNMKSQGINNVADYFAATKGDQVEMPDASAPGNTSFERAVAAQQKREQRMYDQDQSINNFISMTEIKLPGGKKLQPYKSNSWLSRAGRAVAKAPYDMTVGFGQSLANTGEKVYLFDRALITGEGAGRKATFNELIGAAKKTPGVVANNLDPRKPEGAVNLAIVLGGAYLGGRAIIKASKVKIGQSTSWKNSQSSAAQSAKIKNLFKKSSKGKDYYFSDKAKTQIVYRPYTKKWFNQQAQKVGLKRKIELTTRGKSAGKYLDVTKEIQPLRHKQLTGQVMNIKEIKRLNKLEKIEAKQTLKAKVKNQLMDEQAARQTDFNTLRQIATSQARKATKKSSHPLRSTTLRIKTQQGYMNREFDLTSSTGRKAYRNAILQRENIRRAGIKQKNFYDVGLQQATAKKKIGLFSSKKGQQKLKVVEIQKPKNIIEPPKTNLKASSGLSFKGSSLLVSGLKSKGKIYLPASSVIAGGMVIKPLSKNRSKALFGSKTLSKSKIDVMSKAAVLPKFDVRSLTVQKPAVITAQKYDTRQKSALKTLLLQGQISGQRYKTVEETPKWLKMPDYSSGSSGGSGRRWNGWFYGEHNRNFRNLNELLGLKTSKGRKNEFF